MQDDVGEISNNNLFKLLELITSSNNLTAKIDVFISLPYLSYGEDNQEESFIEQRSYFGIKYFVSKNDEIHCFYFTNGNIYHVKQSIDEFIDCDDIEDKNIIYRSIPLDYDELNNCINDCIK